MAFRLFKQPRAQLVRRFVVPLAMGIAISIAMIYFAVRQLDQWQLFWTLEAAAYDIRLRASATHQPDDRIVIVDIDEKSLDAEGHWPWPRDRLATLVNRLTDAGATVSAFDVVFAEADSGKDRELLDRLLETPFGQSSSFVALSRELREELDRDKQFARAVARGRVVMGYFFSLSPGTNPKGELPDNGIPYQELRERGVRVQPVAESYGANLPELQQAAVSGGFFSTVPDPDGVLRRVPLFTVYDDRLYPSLALETARLYLGNA
ncbi:MAG: CHASE2 domain-containing protein, partial [Pseudomonadota bacterium]|nr:CHASE2 domain-containing protein [Pseudomonadota bacterium]